MNRNLTAINDSDRFERFRIDVQYGYKMVAPDYRHAVIADVPIEMTFSTTELIKAARRSKAELKMMKRINKALRRSKLSR